MPSIGRSASGLGTKDGHSTGTACLEAHPVIISALALSSPSRQVTLLGIAYLLRNLSIPCRHGFGDGSKRANLRLPARPSCRVADRAGAYRADDASDEEIAGEGGGQFRSNTNG